MRQRLGHVAPDRLQIRAGGGCLAVFGLPVFAAGVFLTLNAAGIVPRSGGDDTPRLVFWITGAIFTSVGAVLAFGRQWTTIDVTRQVVVKERGLLVPMHTVTHPIGRGGIVVVGFEEGDSDTADKFPVGLKLKSGESLTLCSFTQYAESRACAAAIAQHLRADVEDATTDHATRVAPDQADMPLADRLRRSRETRDEAPRPAPLRSEVSRENGGVRIVMPMPRVHPARIAFAVLPIALALFVFSPLLRFFQQTRTPDGWALMFLAAVLFMLVVVPLGGTLKALLRSYVGRTIVTVSPDGVRIAERGIFVTRAVSTLPASEIMEVDYSTSTSLVSFSRRALEEKMTRSHGSRAALDPRMERVLTMMTNVTKDRGVIVKTRRELTRFGGGLPDEEIQYIRSIIRRALAGDLATTDV
jgi:hypothetical protein